MIARLLSSLRLDDLLAVLFTAALLFLSSVYSVEFELTVLRASLFLFAYYAATFSFGRWLALSPRFSTRQRHTLLALALILVISLILLIPGRELMLLEKPKYLLVALAPLLVGWWVTGSQVPARTIGSKDTNSDSWSGYQILRDFAPVLISQMCYLLLHDVIHRISPIDRDSWLLRADHWLLGGNVTQWLEPFVHPMATEWFSLTYSMFLIFPLVLALWFVARQERPALIHLLQALVLCNYLGYLGYLIIPAIGPMYVLEYDIPLAGGWFYQVKESLDQLARVPRDNFPSLHSANTLVVLLAVWRYARPLAWVYFPLAGSCIAATLYLRYHYTVDVLAGLGMGFGLFWLTPKLDTTWHQFAIKVTDRRKILQVEESPP